MTYQRLTDRQMLRLRRAATQDLYLAMAIAEIDRLTGDLEEAREVAGHWRTAAEECGVYPEYPFRWEVPRCDGCGSALTSVADADGYHFCAECAAAIS